MQRLTRHLPSGTPDSTTGHWPLVTGHYSRRCRLALACLLAFAVQPALATPYEVLYDANTDGIFPEDVGWQRFTSQGGAARTVDNGIFTLMAQNPNPNGGSDQYLWDAMESLDPDPGEMFYAEWRMRLLPGSNNSDVGVFLATDGQRGQFSLLYSLNALRSGADNIDYPLDTTVFRTYRLTSVDMLDYTFCIDGMLAWRGFFAPTTLSSWVVFGDQLVASSSASQWDYLMFGVTAVPEPPAPMLVILSGLAAFHRRKAGHFSLSMEDWPCIESQRFWSPWSRWCLHRPMPSKSSKQMMT